MIIFVFLGCNFIFVWYIRDTVLWWGIVFIIEQGYFDNRYISANVSKIRQVIKTFCSNRRWNVSGRIVSAHLAGRSLAWLLRVLGGTFETVFESVRFFYFEPPETSWISPFWAVKNQRVIYFTTWLWFTVSLPCSREIQRWIVTAAFLPDFKSVKRKGCKRNRKNYFIARNK